MRVRITLNMTDIMFGVAIGILIRPAVEEFVKKHVKDEVVKKCTLGIFKKEK